MKWFLIGSVCLLCLVTPAWGTPADDLYNQGVGALQGEKYDDAAGFFVKLVTGYPTGAHVDDARISGGFAYLHGAKYQEAIDFLAPLATSTMPEKASYKATALYFTALAQFSMGQAEKDKAKANADFQAAVTTYSSLIDICTNTPTPDNKSYLEPSIYYRALAQYLREDFPAAEKDLLVLVQDPKFSTSLSRPDYWLRLGSAYGVETNQAVTDKKTPEEIIDRAQKAIDAYTQVSIDPNALVQANQANMEMGEILYMIAQLDPENGAGYKKALEAYRKVRRKDDMIPLQQNRIDQLKAQIQVELQTAGASAASYSNEASLLIGREEDRLNNLKSEPDPIYQALIRMAECYVNLKQPNEARTILHRLAHAQLSPDQQQEVDFQTLYSYVLGGQTDQADKALTDYLTKHGTDPNADSISYQIATELQKRRDYPGALAQVLRSMKDFPKGKYADDALILEASILTSMGKIDQSNAIVDKYLSDNPTSPKANNLLITRGLNKMNSGDLAGALLDLGKVKDNAGAAPEVRAAADASYIQVMSKQRNFDGVIAEAKNFATQYKDSPALSSVLLFSALAMAEKHDPGAITALRELAQKYPKDEAAPFALFSVITIYQQSNDVQGMIQASNELRKAFPEAYSMLVQAADSVTTVLEKQHKFADAIALYEPLTQVSKKDIAATARNKIGTIWLDAAHSMGYYQSLPPTRPAGDPLARPGADRAEADKRLAAAEQSFLQTLKEFPDQSNAVGDAIDGLVAVAKQRRSWSLLKDADMEKYLTDLTASLTTPDIQARVEMAKAGLVFIQKNGASQFPAALDRYKKVVAANPTLVLNRQESDQLGMLSIAAGDFDTAQKTYSDLLDNAPANDTTSRGYAYYGLGAVLFAQGKVADAKTDFLKLEALPGHGLWHPRIDDANYGIALADEQSADPAAWDEAKKIYASLMQLPPGNYSLQAKAMIGYGHILEKQGFALKPAAAGPTEYAIHYYQQPNVMFITATPAQSAEGLFDAGQAYEKMGDKANAKAQYDTLLQTYSTSAPDWAAKAKDAESKLGA